MEMPNAWFACCARSERSEALKKMRMGQKTAVQNLEDVVEEMGKLTKRWDKGGGGKEQEEEEEGTVEEEEEEERKRDDINEFRSDLQDFEHG
jgi:hypothetical protein